MAGIDPRAAVDDKAELAEGVEVGPFAVIGPNVKIGAGTTVGPHAMVEGRTEIGKDNYIGPFAFVGGAPQHTEYKGEDTSLKIGDRNRIREYATIHRGTPDGRGETVIGSDCFVMVGCHIAHDCVLGDRIIMANLASLAGHVVVEDDVVLGGFVGVHQYCRVGAVVMLAAMARVTKDVPPYSLVGGDPPRFLGLNRVGLKRVGMAEDSKKALRQAYRIIFSKSAHLDEGLENAEAELGEVAEVKHLIEFARSSERGLVRD